MERWFLLLVALPFLVLALGILIYGAFLLAAEKRASAGDGTSILGGVTLLEGEKYRIVKEFTDDRGVLHHPISGLRFTGRSYWAYDEAATYHFLGEGVGVAIVALDRPSDSAALPSDLERFLERE